MFGFVKAWRRRRLAKRPFPEEWLTHLDKHVLFYSQLSEEQRRNFLEKLKVFIWEKNWEGVKGLELTDEHRVVIGAAAVRLVLALDLSYYDRTLSIVVYPGHYRHPDQEEGAIFGQVNHWGTVVLSWPAVLAGVQKPTDGRDTAIHEFAHALDLADGGFDGSPPLRESGHVGPWIDAMQEEFDLMQDRRFSRRDLIREYGAQNPAEFFAVVSEVFFERPEALKEKKPDLYRQLRQFYGWDPLNVAFEEPERRGRPTKRERNRNKRRRKRSK